MPSSVVRSAWISGGIDVVPTFVSCTVTPGPPCFHVVGVSGAAAVESASRVRCALSALGISLERLRVVVQVGPVSVRPSGTSADLAVAAAVLVALGRMEPVPDDVCVVGGLTVDGRAVPVAGLSCHRHWADENGLRLACPPSATVPRAVPLPDAWSLLTATWEEAALPVPASRDRQPSPARPAIAEALAAQAAGESRVLLLRGPAASLHAAADEVRRSLPALAGDTLSLAGRLHDVLSLPFDGTPPLVTIDPRHDSIVEIVGGGRPVRPGSASLSTGGALVIDGVTRVHRASLAALSQALSRGSVSVVRAEGAWEVPVAPAAVVALTDAGADVPAERTLGCLSALGFVEVRV